MGCLDDIIEVVNESAKPNFCTVGGVTRWRVCCADVQLQYIYFGEVTVKFSLKGIS